MNATERLRRLLLAAAILTTIGEFVFGGQAVEAETLATFAPTIDDWGEYGMMQVPSARTGTDGDFHFYFSNVQPYTRFGFDITALPWLEAGFRYTDVGNRLYGPTSFSGSQTYKDRSFSVKVRLIQEGEYWPETSVGIRDIAGTGLFSSEYLVFSRRYYDFDFTGGIGWGLMSSNVSFPNPLGLFSSFFKTRPAANGNNAGSFSPVFFRGPAGLFGGVEYHTPFHGVDLKLELDPDNYKSDPLGNSFVVRSPVNAGIQYKPFSFLDISAGFERGTTLMLRAALHANFNEPGLPIQDAPPPQPPVRHVSEPIGQSIEEAGVPLVVAQSGPISDRLIFEDVPMPSPSRAGSASPPPANATIDHRPVGVPFAQSNLPRTSDFITGDTADLFDTAKRLGIAINDVNIHGDTATLAVSSPQPLRDRERAALREQALQTLPSVHHVDIEVSEADVAPSSDQGAAPTGPRSESTAPAGPETASVDRLYSGAHDLGYKIENVAMDGDVATISVKPDGNATRQDRDRLIRLALANLPGTSQAEVVDVGHPLIDFNEPFRLASLDPFNRPSYAKLDPRSASFGRDLFTELDAIGFTGLSFALHGSHATLAFSQSKYRDNAKAIGRAARVVLRHIPPDIEAITIDMLHDGLTVVSVTMQRADLERAIQSNGSPEEIWANTQLSGGDEYVGPAFVNPKAYPSYTWSLTPATQQQLGGPNNFLIYEVYAELAGEVTLRRGLTVNGTLGAALFGNVDTLKLESTSELPHVRSDIKDYLQQGKYGIFDLQADYMFDIAPNLYGRVSGGLLEQMFGGIDAEILYRPYGERWAVGLDVNHVWQRGFNELFSFQDYNVTTAHLSLYYKLPFYNLTAQLSAGQYLAGDRGATIQLSRKFDDGIVIGVFATKTNVSAAQFGEGAFDKGFFVTVPLDLLFGAPTTSTASYVYRPLTRDGGQQLSILKPLYDQTDGADIGTITGQWPHLLD